ncbi:HNH endonuclease [Gordonia westfalica]|uniref:HNH endonuclease n=1 Tax=Gordonia westfalica TaxID=158898 RepID=A0A1H2L900_9ACTN|nr:HNH endonuclease [Gordonia westfalica]
MPGNAEGTQEVRSNRLHHPHSRPHLLPKTPNHLAPIQGRNVPHRLQTACFRRDQYTCQRCGHHGNPGDGTLHADHTRNRAAGGPNHLDNLETLCTECHKPKTQREAKAGKGL